MSSYTVRSRLAKKKRQRKRKKQTRAFGALALLVVIAVTTGVLVYFIPRVINSGKELGRSIKYPFEYSEYIVKYSAENDLDPYLVTAVIKQESKFIPDARSDAGAGGLMQLMPVTAEEYGRKLGLTDYNYMDPETNIKIGCFVLRTLIDKYSGSVDTALAAYNGGPANVDLWLQDPAYSSDGVTLINIPIEETRLYVEKVNQYMEEYRKEIEIEDE